ncbi:MAG: CDP-alcohol phosphatidyltransferase family protein [Pseudomonadales bacterium]|jgi:phosphatidylglycerophosphate synthase|nr:CDP-alcohol phosphatidyltransferase family protein [Pseudomonadales bacterium]
MTDLHSDISTRPATAGLLPLRGPVARLGVAALAGAPVVAALATVLVGTSPTAVGLAVGGYLVAAGLAVALMRRGYPHGALGLCNLVTLARLGLTAALLAPLLGVASGWAVLAAALVAFALDGVDGWLARREGRVSEFGARFDMEVDAALGLILALNAWAAGTVGPTVLLLGLPRYVFIAAARVLPWMARPLPERFGRKTVCVVQIAALIALQAPVVGGPVAAALVAVAATALAWSFGRDLWWLWQRRG